MNLEVRDNCLIITPGKELDHHIAAIIKEKADDYVMRNKVKDIIFDFTGTEFMDSSGIGVIMGRYKTIQHIGGHIGIVNSDKNIDRIVLLSGLHKLVHTYDSLDIAVKSLKEEL